MSRERRIEKAAIKQFEKERIEMLKKCDVAEMRNFVNSHKEYYTSHFVREINNASETMAAIVLHQTIVANKRLSIDDRLASAIWLRVHIYGERLDRW